MIIGGFTSRICAGKPRNFPSLQAPPSGTRVAARQRTNVELHYGFVLSRRF